MSMQYIAAAGVLVALVIVAMILWGIDLPVPGMHWKVEVNADVKKGLYGDPSVSIGDWRVYRGFSIVPSPLIFEESYRIVLETPTDSSSKTFSIGINSQKTIKLTADMLDPPRGLVKVTVYDMMGDVMDYDEVTI